MSLRAAKIPASLKEHLTLLEALDRDVIERNIDEFYYLARATYVKDEALLDRFDQVFGKVFKGLESSVATGTAEIPDDWLRKVAELNLSPEELAELEKLGWDKLMETLQKRLEEQQKRHEGGNKWIGTGGKSPFGAYGSHPEGIRIGQKEGRQGKAVKVWDKREFRNLDSSVELGTRNIKVALRPPAQVRPRRGDGRARSRRDDQRHGQAGLARHRDAAPSGTTPSSCC